MKKRLIARFLCLVICLMMAPAAFAEAGEAFGQFDPADGTPQTVTGTLKAGRTVTADVSPEVPFVYYKFVPAETGYYRFASDSGKDTYGYLYSSSWELIKNNSEASPGLRDFSLLAELTSGTTYYLGVGFYDNDNAGSIPATLTKLRTGWFQSGEDWYYLNGDGTLASEWKKVGDTWYYFENSKMVYDCSQWTYDEKSSGYTLYFFKKSGAWDGTSGWKQCSDGSWYYAGSGGVLLTGWQTIGGSKYYFFYKDGKMYANGVYGIEGDNKLYLFTASGAVASAGWNKIVYTWERTDESGAGQTQTREEWYYVDGDGNVAIGWKNIGGKWYFFVPHGEMQTGWVESGGKWYYMDPSGAMKTGWVNSGGKWYYMDSDGAMQTGWVKSGGDWYYMNSDGAMQTGWVNSGGKWYYMDSDGAMQTGWVKSGGSWYYMNSDGAMQTGWLYDGGSWYYLDSSGAMLSGTSREINGKVYHFDTSGVCTDP